MCLFLAVFANLYSLSQWIVLAVHTAPHFHQGGIFPSELGSFTLFWESGIRLLFGSICPNTLPASLENDVLLVVFQVCVSVWPK